METPADCLRCVVCCHSTLPTYVRVTGEDWSRLGDAADRLAHFVGHRAFMRMSGGHCAALELRRAAGGGTEFFCTVYDRRPRICRDLARGSPECAGELATKAERVAAGDVSVAATVVVTPAQIAGP